MEFYQLNLSLIIVILYFPSLFCLELEKHSEENNTDRRIKRNHASDKRKNEEAAFKYSQIQNQAPNALKKVNPAGLVNSVLQIPSTIIKIIPKNSNQQHQTPKNEPFSIRRSPPLIQNKIPIQSGRNLNNTKFIASTNKKADISFEGTTDVNGLKAIKTYNISRNLPGNPGFHTISVYKNDDSKNERNRNEKIDEPNQRNETKSSKHIEKDANSQQKVLSEENNIKMSENQDNITSINNTIIIEERNLSGIENIVINESINKTSNDENNGNGTVVIDYSNSDNIEVSNIKPVPVNQTASSKTEDVMKKLPDVLRRGHISKKNNKGIKKSDNKKDSTDRITESLNIIKDLIEKLKSPDIATSISLDGANCGKATAEILTDLNEEEKEYESERSGCEDLRTTSSLNTREQVYPVRSNIYYKGSPYDYFSKNSQLNKHSSPNWSYYVQPVGSYESIPAGKYQNLGEGCNKPGLKQAYYVVNVKPKNCPRFTTYGGTKSENSEQTKNKDFDTVLRSRTDTELIIKGKTVEPLQIGARNQFANDKKAINVAPSTLSQNQGLVNVNSLYRNQNIPLYACLK